METERGHHEGNGNPNSLQIDMLDERKIDVGGKKDDEKKIGDDEAKHEESIDPVDRGSSQIDEEAEDQKEGERAYPRRGAPSGDKGDRLEKERGAACDIGCRKRIEKKQVGDPANDTARGAECAARHGDEVHLSRK